MLFSVPKIMKKVANVTILGVELEFIWYSSMSVALNNQCQSIEALILLKLSRNASKVSIVVFFSTILRTILVYKVIEKLWRHDFKR
jgi:hypothetical protein